MAINPSNQADARERVSRRYSGDEKGEGGTQDNKQRLLFLVMAVALTFFIVMVWGERTFVTKESYGNDITNIVKDIGSLKTTIGSINDLSNRVSGAESKANSASQVASNVQSALGSYAKNDSLTQINSNISSLQGNMNSVLPSISDIKSRLSSLEQSTTPIKAQSASNETKLAALEARVKTLEASSSSGSSVVGSIPNVVIEVKVTDEGTLQTSNNSTVGQIKLTLVNNGTRDIEDIVLYVVVVFDNSGYANQTISASYGTWTVRERQRDEIQLKGRLPRLTDGETRRIYIDITSFATDYQLGNRTTYLDTSSKDIDIIDWSYGS